MNKLKGKVLAIIIIMFGLVLFVSQNVSAAELIEKITLDAYDFVPYVGEKLYHHTVGSEENYEIVSQTWYDINDSVITDSNRLVNEEETKKESGKSFYYEIIIKAKSGYEFSDTFLFELKNETTNSHIREGALNQEKLANGNIKVGFGMYAYKPIQTNIVIDGSNVAYSLSNGTLYDQNVLENEAMVEGVQYANDFWSGIPDEAKLGEEYTFRLILNAKDGYLFKKGTTVNVNGVDWKSTTNSTEIFGSVGTKNGTYIRHDAAIVYDTYNSVEINAETLDIGLGKNVPTISINSTEYEVVSQKWLDANDDEITKFDKVGEYTYKLILKPSKYNFGENTSVELTGVNWQYTSLAYLTSGANAGCIEFTGNVKVGKLIKKVEIDLSSIKPELNKNVGKITLNSDEYEMNMQDWFKMSDASQPINKFDEKTMYVYAIALTAKDGYVFADDVKINIKGITWDSIVVNGHDSQFIHFAAGINLGNKLNVTKGQNQTYITGKTDALSFTINADSSKFDTLYILGMPASSNIYEITGDSKTTTITFKKETIDGIAEDEYSFVASFGDTGIAVMNFVVDDPETEYVPGKTDASENIKKNPGTSDNIMLVVGILAVSVTSVVITITALNKKSKIIKNN